MGMRQPRDKLLMLRAQAMRNEPTPAEQLLWMQLRSRRLGGLKFRRQIAIDHYICDFVAREQRLIIELDGGRHGDSAAYDGRRDARLTAAGYRVLHFWNIELRTNMAGVLTIIANVAASCPPSGPLSAGELEQVQK